MPPIFLFIARQRVVLDVAVNLAALLIYAVGLIAPLTPSEGLPSLMDIVVFVGIPVALLFWCIRASRSRLIALIVGLQIATVLFFSASLLQMQLHV